jgi:hypothetical protein
MKIITSLFIISYLLGGYIPAQQVDAIIMAPSIHTMDVLLTNDISNWLDAMRPGGTNIYAVMNYTDNQNGIYISLAGLDPATPPPYNWQIENGQGESNVIWTGTLTRKAGKLELFTVPGVVQPVSNLDLFNVLSVIEPVSKLGSMMFSGPGGGAEIAFPWSVGSKMMYGTRGVHGGGFSFGIGLDFVGGNDLGAGVAGDTVYASAAGTITAVCRDSTSVGIKVEGGGNKIAYFHLKDSDILAEGTTFARGTPIGRLVHGQFNNTCGWAAQQPTHYHIHWVVEPSAGKFRAEGYVLDTSSQKWTRGNEVISMSQYIQGGGGTGDIDDPGSGGGLVIIPGGESSGGGSSMWDFVVIGVNNIYGMFKTWYAPSVTLVNPQNEQMWTLAGNMMRTMIKDANVYLVNDSLNVLPFAIVYGVMLFMEGIKWIAIGILIVINLVKDIKGLALTS